ncbi:Sterol regulatory element-binding protein ECM22 [Pseudocercospora fuligena]|uniref:Sterol regulatory element-binding protein ECM22 n=1 Tax=Pseudocercospora fuligena TaxID=685502 RepID=A0A8H6RTY1_9PEZI|nr:Sterol regulatory element-binding protein ECM22 [Pseudocercospora fuligena]
MPRLNHKKARTGCQRCKARKVKCDEGRPKCAACTRHNVVCEYVEPAPRRTDQQTFPQAQAQQDAYQIGIAPNENLDPRLEIKLMHQWTAYTCQTFSTAFEFWRCQAPLFAMEHRMVLDAMFGLAALHASRQSPSQWIPMDGRMIPIRDPIYNPEHVTRDLSNHWKEHEDGVEIANAVRNANHPDYVGAKRSRELLLNARKYFDRAIDGHRSGIGALTRENVEATYITSILISFQALFTLSETDEDSTLPVVDAIVWLRLADGTRYLCDIWRGMAGDEWLDDAGVYFGRAKLQGAEELFQREEGKPFQSLLTFAQEYETTTIEDKAVFQQAVGALALIYKSITEDVDAPLVNCRRLVAMPSQLARRFTELVEMRNPRAMMIMAYTFATMKILSEKVPWFRGIAEQQIPRIAAQIPHAWGEMMKWPLDIAQNRSESRSQEEDIREVLALDT